MIHREEARLRSLFKSLLLVTAAASPTACSSGGQDGLNDASVPTDATQPMGTDAATDSGRPPANGDSAAPPGADAAPVPDAGVPDANDPFGFIDAACDPRYVPDADVYSDAGDGGDPAVCDFFESLPCGLPPGSVTEGCYLLVSQCGTLCSHVPTLNRKCAVAECLAVDASSVQMGVPVTLECATADPTCAPGVGRRPAGMERARGCASRDAVGAALASMAHHEAASVFAFRRLGAELTAMGAPPVLVRGAARSARDEVRHARVMARLARKRGAKPARVAIRGGRSERTRGDFAVENAIEGCVRESFGALLATRQAASARDGSVARAREGIAKDETRHAALAWGIARWLSPRLSDEERACVAKATREALATLRAEVAAFPADVARELGLPTGEEALRLVDGFAADCVRDPALGANANS